MKKDCWNALKNMTKKPQLDKLWIAPLVDCLFDINERLKKLEGEK